MGKKKPVVLTASEMGRRGGTARALKLTRKQRIASARLAGLMSGLARRQKAKKTNGKKKKGGKK